MKSSRILLSLLSIALLAGPLHAEVEFVRNIPLPARYAPILPLRTGSAVTPYQYLLGTTNFWRLAPGETTWELVDDSLINVKANSFSVALLDNSDPSRQSFTVYGTSFSTYNYSIYEIRFKYLNAPYVEFGSVLPSLTPFGNGKGIVLTATNNVYSIPLADVSGAPATLLFGGLINPSNIQASSDGGIWVLSHLNTQLEKYMETSEGWGMTTSFTIEGNFDGTIAEAISGELILGDGLGGGSLYSPDGTLLETFSSPVGTVATNYIGTPYVNIDANGLITIYANSNPHTIGSHEAYNQYQYTAAVPEPATSALVGAGVLVLWIAHRRRQLAG